MSKMHFTVEIQAPKEKVWNIMLADKTYRQWTGAFHEGSYFEGSWEKGSKIRFLAADDGKVGGMSSKIVENKPYEYISIEHIGEIADGQEVTSEWTGAHENYTLQEKNGMTTLTVELESDIEDDEMMEMLQEMWPPALAKLKEIVEE